MEKEQTKRADWLSDETLDHPQSEYCTDELISYYFTKTVDDFENKAQQVFEAVHRLIYEWFNNHGCYDNNHGFMCEDRYYVNAHGFYCGYSNSVYNEANWLALYVDGTKEILDQIQFVENDIEYQRLLYKLSQYVWSVIVKYNNDPIEGDITSCDAYYYFDNYEHIDEEDNEEYFTY